MNRGDSSPADPIIHHIDHDLPQFDPNKSGPRHDGFSDLGERWIINPSEYYCGPYIAAVAAMPHFVCSLSNILTERLAPSDLVEKLKVPDIDFGILNQRGLNCVADLFNDKYSIAMEGALPICALELSIHFLSKPDVFPNIGDTSRIAHLYLSGTEEIPFFQIEQNRFIPLVGTRVPERSQEGLYRSAISISGNARRFSTDDGSALNAATYIKQFDSLIEYLLPNCPIRRKYVYFSAFSLCLFFWMHEVAHVTNGHLLRLDSFDGDGPLRLFEHPNFDSHSDAWATKSYDLDEDLLLAMEIDADSDAMMFIVSLILEGHDDSLFGSADDGNFPETTVSDRVTLFLIMVYGALNALRQKEIHHPLPTSNTRHPRFSVRLKNVFAIVQRMSEADDRLKDCIDLLFSFIDATKSDVAHSRVFSGQYDENIDTEFDEILRLNGVLRKDITDGSLVRHGSLKVMIRSVMNNLIDKGIAESF